MGRYLAVLTGTTPSRSRPSSVNVPVYANCNKMNEINIIIMQGMNKRVSNLAQIMVEPSIVYTVASISQPIGYDGHFFWSW